MDKVSLSPSQLIKFENSPVSVCDEDKVLQEVKKILRDVEHAGYSLTFNAEKFTQKMNELKRDDGWVSSLLEKLYLYTGCQPETLYLPTECERDSYMSQYFDGEDVNIMELLQFILQKNNDLKYLRNEMLLPVLFSIAVVIIMLKEESARLEYLSTSAGADIMIKEGTQSIVAGAGIIEEPLITSGDINTAIKQVSSVKDFTLDARSVIDGVLSQYVSDSGDVASQQMSLAGDKKEEFNQEDRMNAAFILSKYKSLINILYTRLSLIIGSSQFHTPFSR